MEEKYIGKYRLTTDLRGQNSGNARWGFCTYNSNEYFIKEFISPVYPEASAPISDEVRAALIREGSAFEQRKNRLYTAINASTNGNIIGIRSFFRFKSRYYIVTEKVETGKTKVSEIAELSMEKKIILLRVLLYSIRCIHDAGIVHADIKPDNLILKPTQNGYYTLKLIDFDASFFEDDQPKNSDDIHGDLSYLAPETFLRIAGENKKITRKADIFALGIIFHEFLTGVRPRMSGDYDYLYEAVLDGGDIGISNRLPLPIHSLIRRMLDIDPKKRPSAADIFDYFGEKTSERSGDEGKHFSRDSSLD